MRRISHRDTKVSSDHVKLRIPGEKGSYQNELRYKLYTAGFDQMKAAFDGGYYIECVSICESMITDRLNAYVQYLLHNDEKQFISQSLHNSLLNFGSATKEKDVRDPEFSEIYKNIENWIPQRNTAVHNFVIVDSNSITDDLDKRYKDLKLAAINGMNLIREVMSYTQKRTKIPNL